MVLSCLVACAENMLPGGDPKELGNLASFAHFDLPAISSLTSIVNAKQLLSCDNYAGCQKE
jgi:hypothetical protein